ncbi:MAG: hypothetical protein JO147_00005, partial [Actinobacteria bacterium]|nr:hypothetical protein [Actinomycetota bacterium]
GPTSARPNGALYQGETITSGQAFYSSNGSNFATQQGDGNFVVYQAGLPRWATNTAGHSGAFAVMQSDGNFVVYSSSGSALYATGSSAVGTSGGRLTVQDDANLVIYQANGTPIWAANYSVAAPSGFDVTLTQPPTSTSRYIRNLSSNTTTNATIMTDEGCADAHANPAGHPYVTLLDFGAQISLNGGYGVQLTVTTIRISNAAVIAAVRSYIDGYTACMAAPTHLSVAIGTNNDGPDTLLGAAGGALWASGVINPLSAYAAPKGVEIIGANDMEPGFSGSMAQAADWLNGYLGATGASFLFFGSADGCPTTLGATTGSCNYAWTLDGLYQLAFGASPQRSLAMPEIYVNAQARQWTNISLTGYNATGRPVAYAGPMTEVTACAQAGSCASMSTSAAWSLLLNTVNTYVKIRLTGMLYSTDLRIDS